MATVCVVWCGVVWCCLVWKRTSRVKLFSSHGCDISLASRHFGPTAHAQKERREGPRRLLTPPGGGIKEELERPLSWPGSSVQL